MPAREGRNVADMDVGRRDQPRFVSGHRRFEDFAMLGRDDRRIRQREPGDIAVAQGLGEHLRAQLLQQAQGTGARDGVVEGGVSKLPRRIAPLARVDDAALRMGELVEGRNDLALPDFVAVKERETQDVGLDEPPGLGQIVQILLRHHIDPKAVASLEDDELFGRKARQRLAQRTHAHPVARGKRGQQQALAGFELSGDDVPRGYART